MELETDQILIDQCKTRIEEKLGWGSGEHWTTQDFEALSEKIQKETSVNLSLATLKRIWGKMKYESKPTITTLNALVQYLGYENWHTFKKSQTSVNGHGHEADAKTVFEYKVIKKNPVGNQKSRWISIVVLLVLAGLTYYIFLSTTSQEVFDPQAFKFTSAMADPGAIPNSVIFDYDATPAGTSDTIYIQQSWDPRLKEKVSRNDHRHTSIYYYPGFFQAKLVVNHQIVKEHDIFIQSKEWLALIEQPQVPVYFPESEAVQNGELRLTPTMIEGKNIPLQPNTPWVSYYRVQDFGNIYNDNFLFETKLKNDYKEGSAVCQHSEIRILYEGNVILIPLTIKGCVSNIKLNSAIKDPMLELLGCDFSKWVDVRCEVRSGKGKVLVNQEQAFEFELPPLKKKIIGLSFRFQGTGSLDYVKLANADGTVVFDDGFNR